MQAVAAVIISVRALSAQHIDHAVFFIRHPGIIIGRDDISNAVRIGFVSKFYLLVMLSSVFRHI